MNEELVNLELQIKNTINGLKDNENETVFYVVYNDKSHLLTSIGKGTYHSIGYALFQLACEDDDFASIIETVSERILDMKKKLKEEEANIAKLN
jgi:hypothetical protein